MEGKAEKTFRDFGKKLDEMIAELQSLKTDIENRSGSRWDELNKSKEKIEEELKQFKERNKDRFEEAEERLEQAGTEIKKAFEALFSKKEGSKKENEENSSEH